MEVPHCGSSDHISRYFFVINSNLFAPSGTVVVVVVVIILCATTAANVVILPSWFAPSRRLRQEGVYEPWRGCSGFLSLTPSRKHWLLATAASLMRCGGILHPSLPVHHLPAIKLFHGSMHDA